MVLSIYFLSLMVLCRTFFPRIRNGVDVGCVQLFYPSLTWPLTQSSHLLKLHLPLTSFFLLLPSLYPLNPSFSSHQTSSSLFSSSIPLLTPYIFISPYLPLQQRPLSYEPRLWNKNQAGRKMQISSPIKDNQLAFLLNITREVHFL